ncbi:MAG: leucine-rich repeat protein, partial [Lachnospiraceae bacterium]|nr:leucine-rich repeat protein [Lachnospiraceae bacterium]
MRKQTKKLLSWVLTGALALGLVSNVNVSTVNAADEATPQDIEITVTPDAITYGKDGDARMSLVNEWSDQAMPELTQYSYRGIKVNFHLEGVAKALEQANVSTFDAELEFTENQQTWFGQSDGKVSKDKLKTSITQDGDYEVSATWDEKGPMQIKTYLAIRFKALDSIITEEKGPAVASNPLVFSNVKVTLLNVGDAVSGGDDPEEPDDTVSPSSFCHDEKLWNTPGMHAYVGFQTNVWDCRNAVSQEGEVVKIGKKYSPVYVSYKGTEPDPKDVTLVDKLLDKDNIDYTISFSGLDLTRPDMEGKNWDGDPIQFNALSVATDINKTVYKDVKVTGVTLKVDDKVKNTTAVTCEAKDDTTSHYAFMLVNGSKKAPFKDMAKDILPTSKVEITFHISGLAKPLQDLKDGKYVNDLTGTTQKADYLTQSTGGDQKPQDTKGVNGTKKGKTFTAGNFKYKVTKAATITAVSKKKEKGTVTVVGLAKKNATSINVKNTVKKGTAEYKVTAIGSKAFQKAKKLKKATLGTNIKSIPTSAFNGCVKLTTVSAKGVTKIGKTAFKGCKKLSKLTLKKKLS